MKKIEIHDSGYIDRQDSAFPTVVRLDDGDIICGFSVGGGPKVTGGTHWALSRDDGKTWQQYGLEFPERCEHLLREFRTGRYKAPAIRRV